MAQKRSLFSRTDTSDSDDPEPYQYPVFSDEDGEIGSPTKALRVYKQPLKRRQISQSSLHRRVEGEEAASNQNSVNVMRSQADITEPAECPPPDQTSGIPPSADHRVDWESPPHTPPRGDDDHCDDAQPSNDNDTGQTPHGVPVFTEHQIAQYREAVENFTAGFDYIEGSIFVVQGWDVARQCTVNNWYHLQFIKMQGDVATACTCPQSLQLNSCIHRAFFRSFEVESLEEGLGDVLDTGGSPRATIFARQNAYPSSDFLTLFSVSALSRAQLKARAIVSHMGSDPKTGVWKCQKDSGALSCSHISAARKVLAEQVRKEEGIVRREESDDDESQDRGEDASPAPVARPLASLSHKYSISYLPVLPPLTATLRSDRKLYSRPHPLRSPPQVPLYFKLDSDSRCRCASPKFDVFNASQPVSTRPCKVFTLLSVIPAVVEIQTCPSSARVRGKKCIGPDLRQQGIFNYNNSTMVTHELLDEYTMAYTGSETTFTAFVALVSHRYAMSGGAPFMGEDLFRSVWFAYISIQELENDMTCLRCGQYPETIIWDGITLAFGKKHLTGSLNPPTIPTSDSIVRTKPRNRPRQQLIKDQDTRSQLRRALVFPDMRPVKRREPQGSDSEDEPEVPAKFEERRKKQIKDITAYFELVDKVQESLQDVCAELSHLFGEVYSATWLSRSSSVHSAYKSFFSQIAAEESVLQLVNGSALVKLKDFLSDPALSRASILVCIPCLYNIITHRKSLDLLVPIMTWISERVDEVLLILTVEDPLDDVRPWIKNANVKVDDWMTTGRLYGFPTIRARPWYPNIRTDQKLEVSKPRGDRCGKHFNTYGDRGTTGGIMVVWCTHSVCYGFHCIPQCEGRNDVFSAIVSHWPKAPKHIIYDFACALGPYCMLREPDFFKDTLFAIDHFHAAGHTKCSEAAMLSNYANVMLELNHVNSSAAEAGNSGLKRIRKGVSYMTERHAIIYTKVFLSISNRKRLIRQGA